MTHAEASPKDLNLKSNTVIVWAGFILSGAFALYCLLFLHGETSGQLVWLCPFVAYLGVICAQLRSGYQFRPWAAGCRGLHRSENPRAFTTGILLDVAIMLAYVLIFR